MIRKLHYIILDEQIPPANICTTIKAVLKYKQNTTEARGKQID